MYNSEKPLGRSLAGISFAEAMTQAGRDLAVQRFLMSSAAYRKAFSARMHELMGVTRVDAADTSPNGPQSGSIRVIFAHEPGSPDDNHPGEPK